MSRAGFACLTLLAVCGTATAASPSLGSVQPRGAQRGTDATFVLGGGNLADAQEVVFYSPGLTVTKLEVVNAGQVKVAVKIAADARLGEHALRVRTATGLTELRTLWVGALPVVDEKEPNSEFTAPQKIPLNVTVHGVADNEDVDYYAVEAKKGQRISVEIEGMRLATTFFDPYVAILDAKRFELAASDDTPLFKQDGCLSIVAPADGTYTVMVRETSYQGNGGCQYRLHVGTFPRPLAVVPAGGKLGEEVELRFIGDATGDIKQKIKLPAVMPKDGKFEVFCQDAGGISPSGLPFRLSENAANVIEVEPNDTPAQATTGVWPCAFNGAIDKPGDIDHFKFAAKKGQVLDVHCYARRLGSALDSLMYMGLMGAGAMIGNDDAIGPDSYFRVTIPQDGEYWISVTDHLKKGGPAYAYRIEVTAVEPKLVLSAPPFALYTQERQVYPVPRGNRFATFVNASRIDFGGDLNVQPAGRRQRVVGGDPRGAERSAAAAQRERRGPGAEVEVRGDGDGRDRQRAGLGVEPTRDPRDRPAVLEPDHRARGSRAGEGHADVREAGPREAVRRQRQDAAHRPADQGDDDRAERDQGHQGDRVPDQGGRDGPGRDAQEHLLPGGGDGERRAGPAQPGRERTADRRAAAAEERRPAADQDGRRPAAAESDGPADEAAEPPRTVAPGAGGAGEGGQGRDATAEGRAEEELAAAY